jgi:hypothetical protein
MLSKLIMPKHAEDIAEGETQAFQAQISAHRLSKLLPPEAQ